MATRLWPTPRVARILRVDHNTLSGWKKEGCLVPDRTDVVPFLYKTETITAFLRRNAKGFGNERPPTFNDLVRRYQRLYTPSELTSILGLSQSGVSWHTTHGTLPAFALSKRAVRYPSAPIKRLLSAIPKDDAARILGIVPHMIFEVVRAGKLDRLNVPGHGTALFVTRESLYAYLADRLAESGVPAGIWWQDQLAYDNAMLSPSQICDTLRIAWPTVDDLLTSGRLPSIRTPGDFRLVPERYVRWLEAGRIPTNQPPAWGKRGISAITVAAAFGVLPDVARRWIRRGAFCGGQHGVCVAEECLRRFITEHRTNTAFTAEQWIQWASPSDPTTLVDAEGIVDLDDPLFAQALRENRLRGVRSPGGQLVVHEPDLRRFLNWYERQILGPDYHQSS